MKFLASASFDSPATTDADLAVLAAEAGLFDPEPTTKFTDNEENTFIDDSGVSLSNSQVSSAESGVTEDGNTNITVAAAELSNNEEMAETTQENSTEIDTATKSATSTDSVSETTTTSIGLFGGAKPVCKLNLKGGGKFQLGLLGGSPVFNNLPSRPHMWRKGLCGGGNGDSDLPTNASIFPSSNEAVSLGTSLSTPLATNNTGTFSNNSETNMEEDNNSFNSLDIKTEYDEEEEEDFSLRLPSGSEENLKADGFEVKEEFDEKIKRESDETEERKISDATDNTKSDEPVGDALSTLASAALGRATPQIYSKAEVNFIFIF